MSPPPFEGNDYISNYVEYRGGPKDINTINDPRNGLLLFDSFHKPFGRAEVAFLKTPNFGLAIDDIPFDPPRTTDQQSPVSRLTLHHFVSVIGAVVSNMAPTTLMRGHPKRPPNVILDSVYAAMALQAWGPKSFHPYAREKMK
ncbi:hypothetical protein BS47DRAFT_1330827 [Hydnum rufescens UP504]|uniref:HNH nuclease domain-containing protein n=1 Tax=Hydnum rufescens UP504 TaxID=1448309 RepID=A0A9P6DS26_9AGAM|nr:hypothetical protein BS47DRAFT_1330827 [Hydnum rufescens UP504]